MISNINGTLLNKIREYFRKTEITAIEKGTTIMLFKKEVKRKKVEEHLNSERDMRAQQSSVRSQCGKKGSRKK